MKLDLAQLLQVAIQSEHIANQAQGLSMKPELAKQRAYVQAEGAIVHLMDAMGVNDAQSASEDLLPAYLALIDKFFLVAAKQTWSHLIVMTPDGLDELATKQLARSLNQQALATTQFLLKSYFERQQAAFEHAWHLVLKWGLVDLKLKPETIEREFLALKM